MPRVRDATPLSITIGATCVTVLIAGLIIFTHPVLTCMGSDRGFGACLHAGLRDSGLLFLSPRKEQEPIVAGPAAPGPAAELSTALKVTTEPITERNGQPVVVQDGESVPGPVPEITTPTEPATQVRAQPAPEISASPEEPGDAATNAETRESSAGRTLETSEPGPAKSHMENGSGTTVPRDPDHPPDHPPDLAPETVPNPTPDPYPVPKPQPVSNLPGNPAVPPAVLMGMINALGPKAPTPVSTPEGELHSPPSGRTVAAQTERGSDHRLTVSPQARSVPASRSLSTGLSRKESGLREEPDLAVARSSRAVSLPVNPSATEVPVSDIPDFSPPGSSLPAPQDPALNEHPDEENPAPVEPALEKDAIQSGPSPLVPEQFVSALQPAAATLTIRPGDNLWTIAARLYGGGARYREIYEANRQIIADPHWIYPGQVLVLPARPAPSE